MFPPHKRATYIIKLVGGCNLKCRYCYHLGHNPSTFQSRLDLPIIEKLISQSSPDADVVEFIWHGGEPLLAGMETFQTILEIQRRKFGSKKVQVRNLVQTNATLINANWIELFLRGGFGVGVSLDGPLLVHNSCRKYPTGRGSFEDTMHGIRLLQSAEIPFSVLSVVTKSSLSFVDEIFDFFVNENIKKFDFLPCVEFEQTSGGNLERRITQESLDRGDFAKFMVRIFDLWFERDEPSIGIRYLEEIITGLLGGRPSLCKFSGDCYRFVTINADGTLSACDNLPGDGELRFGDLGKQSLDEILNSRKRSEFVDAVTEKRSECNTCKYVFACGGGCNKYSYMWKRDFRDRNYLCGDRQRIFGHVSRIMMKEHPSMELISESQ